MGIGQRNKTKGEVTEEQAFKIWQRENESCPLCNRGLTEPPAPHHIFAKSNYYGDDRDEDWNLSPLCLICHKKFDGKPKQEDKKLKQKALRRYDGENREKLKTIYQRKGHNKS